MAHYKAKTPKRHVAWSSSPAIRFLDLGKLRNFDFRSADYKKHKTAKVTISKRTGKKQFTGNRKQLKESQRLGCEYTKNICKSMTMLPCCFFWENYFILQSDQGNKCHADWERLVIMELMFFQLIFENIGGCGTTVMMYIQLYIRHHDKQSISKVKLSFFWKATNLESFGCSGI